MPATVESKASILLTRDQIEYLSLLLAYRVAARNGHVDNDGARYDAMLDALYQVQLVESRLTIHFTNEPVNQIELMAGALASMLAEVDGTA